MSPYELLNCNRGSQKYSKITENISFYDFDETVANVTWPAPPCHHQSLIGHDTQMTALARLCSRSKLNSETAVDPQCMHI